MSRIRIIVKEETTEGIGIIEISEKVGKEECRVLHLGIIPNRECLEVLKRIEGDYIEEKPD